MDGAISECSSGLLMYLSLFLQQQYTVLRPSFKVRRFIINLKVTLLNPEVFFFKVVLASVVFCVSMLILETLSMSIKKTSQDFD
jgi:hypothetical protein